VQLKSAFDQSLIRLDALQRRVSFRYLHFTTTSHALVSGFPLRRTTPHRISQIPTTVSCRTRHSQSPCAFSRIHATHNRRVRSRAYTRLTIAARVLATRLRRGIRGCSPLAPVRAAGPAKPWRGQSATHKMTARRRAQSPAARTRGPSKRSLRPARSLFHASADTPRLPPLRDAFAPFACDFDAALPPSRSSAIFAARSVLSHENSLRPKWPYEAVFL